MVTPIARVYVIGEGGACCWKLRVTSGKVLVLTAPEGDMQRPIAFHNISNSDHQGDVINLGGRESNGVYWLVVMCSSFPIARELVDLVIDESDLLPQSEDIINALPF